jgi:hypothetical protein
MMERHGLAATRAPRPSFRLALKLLLGSLMTIAVSAASAQAAIYHVLTRDQFAYALAFSSSADGCTSSALEVFASKSMTRYVSDFSIYMPIVRAQGYSINYCTGAFVFASGADEAPVIDIKPDLTRATAKATVVMIDELGNQQTVQLNLVWSGGDLSSDKTKLVYTSPYSRTMIRSAGSIRNSNSITGSLTLDGVDVLAIPGSWTTGFVVSSKGASIDIIRSPRP